MLVPVEAVVSKFCVVPVLVNPICTLLPPTKVPVTFMPEVIV